MVNLVQTVKKDAADADEEGDNKPIKHISQTGAAKRQLKLGIIGSDGGGDHPDDSKSAEGAQHVKQFLKSLYHR